MSDVAIPPAVPEAVHPPSISLRDVWPWALFAVALLVLIYFVGFDQGALSIVPGQYIHEFAHDGRHVLAFPCH